MSNASFDPSEGRPHVRVGDEAWPVRVVRHAQSRRYRLVFDGARGKHMLIYPERGLELNEVGHAILKLCDGQNSVAQLVELLAGRFER